MISHFFIDRPIFAAVLSIVLTIAGGVAITALPVAQYPDVTPPTVLVTASYPGANAQTVRDTIAAPIEQQVSGVENMLYMCSQSTNDGKYTLTVTFKLGMDSDMAQVLVQNRVSLAQPVIPDLVQRQGINVNKQSPSTMMIVNLTSEEDPKTHELLYNDLYLSNYATIQIKDELGRLPGVASISYMGQRDYSMRAWLDPNKLATLNLTARDVVLAINEQNLQVAAGQIGQEPVAKGQAFQLTINTEGRLVEASRFGEIIVKVGQGGPDGTATGVVRLRDLARVERGSQQYDQSCALDGKPSVALSIYQLPGSNAIKTAQGVYDKMKELKKRFPQGLDYKIVYDTTPFIHESIVEVFKTLRDAIVLVAIVVLVFLQSWRATLIPLIAVPVAIIGTFAVMAALGFSLNNLSLFGLVLAIGIVVDDAIVVVENVERWLEQGLPPREAARKAMDEVTGPIIAVALVLCAVFVPCAFITGITGQFFRQFAITIAVSTVFSALNSLTLSPALAAILLKPHGAKKDPLTLLLNLTLGWFFWGFNAAFTVGTNVYTWIVGVTLRLSLIALLVYAGLLGLTYWSFTQVPTGFIPEQDKGYLLVNVQLPDSSSVQRTQHVMAHLGKMAAAIKVPGTKDYDLSLMFNLKDVREIPTKDKGRAIVADVNGRLHFRTFNTWGKRVVDKDEGQLAERAGLVEELREKLKSLRPPHKLSESEEAEVLQTISSIVGHTFDQAVEHTVGVSGQSLILNANAPNLGSMYVMLAEFDERPGLSADAVGVLLREECRKEIREALVTVFGAPPIDGLGTSGGYKIMIEDRGNVGLAKLQLASDQLVKTANDTAELEGVSNSSRIETPWLYLDINRTKCDSLGVSLGEVFNTLQVNLGSYYVNNYNEFGRSWQVNVMADARFRDRVNDILQLKVKNNQGQMIPLATLVRVRDSNGPLMLMRYNMYSATAVTGNLKPGVSSGEGIARMQTIADKLPQGIASDWTELTYMQLQAGNTAMYVFALAVVFVFLVLAAQYESWSLPMAVILVVPMCLLCSVTGVALAKMDVNIFTQIGLVVLVGLASKNAILIVEFAKQQHETGMPRFQATTEACRLRLRPILMTSFAFILGVVPLVIASGAGAEMRRTLGVAVFSGMLGVTFFGIFLTPIFYYVITGLSGGSAPHPPAAAPLAHAPEPPLSHSESREHAIQPPHDPVSQPPPRSGEGE